MMQREVDKLIIIGSLVHAVSFGELELRKNVLITVDLKCGKILQIIDENEHVVQDETCKVIRLNEDQFICPGFIDTHHHAPQTSNLGLGLDRELLGWLQTYTFPREKSYGVRSDESISSEYSEMCKRLLRGGTTCCVYFGSVQERANEILVDSVAKAGQRAFIGKVCMDQNSPLDYCDESCEASVQGTRNLISYIGDQGEKCKLIKPIVTPRFAPTCSMPLLKGLGLLAHESDCHIQTHISENKSEIHWVRDLFPENASYADVYDAAGLLTEKTILAHAIHLTEAEKTLISQRQSAVSHCPNSNFALNSGCLNIRDLLERNIKVSLGTDVAGGYSISMLDACRQAIIASKVCHFEAPASRPLNAAEAFSLATLSGATCLGLESILGNFQVGKSFDALIVDVYANPQIPRGPDDNLLGALFEKFIFCGDDRCIKSVFVNGAEVLPL